MMLAYLMTRPGTPTQIEIFSVPETDNAGEGYHMLEVFKGMAADAVEYIPGVAAEVVGIDYNLSAILWLQHYDAARGAVSQPARDDLTARMVAIVQNSLTTGSGRRL